MIVETMITAMTDAIKQNLGRFCEKGDFSRLTPELTEAVTAGMNRRCPWRASRDTARFCSPMR